jgi:tRNA-2-methylthio-N6-dimethylallyladenosine synthase
MGCSYCIVPETRGREKSRAVADIVAEVARLVAGGAKEIMLLGQNVTAYGVSELRQAGGYTPDQSPFAELLRAVCAVPGLRRLRFTSPHPHFMNAAFVQALAELPQVCDSFHVPLQSGADRILAAMKRNYTVAEYRQRLAAIRAVRPAAAFSTDIIVGFPGETDADFAATRELMAEIGFDMAYVFRYSPRPGTLADRRLADTVPPEVKEARLKLLLADLERRVLAHNQARLGQTVEIMLEGPSPRNPSRWCGRTSDNKRVVVPPAPEMEPGQFRSFRITRATAHTLYGEPA